MIGKSAMKSILWIAMIAAVSVTVFALTQSQDSTNPAETAVFRGPVTVNLHTKNGDYTQNFDKVPYVAKNTVFIFPGESFGVNVSLSGDEISAISYQKDTNKADVTFKFSQEKKSMMMLVIKNKLKQELYLDAFMNLPNSKDVYRTSIIPIGPGLVDFESWPHPIVQLALTHFRFSAQASK